jgi:hypothetical protein
LTVKLYLLEPASDEFNQRVKGRVRQGDLARDVARRMLDTVVARLDDGTFRRVELTRDVHRREHFVPSLTEFSLRAADALHLALAVSGRAATVASFEARLGAAARGIGLATYPA